MKIFFLLITLILLSCKGDQHTDAVQIKAEVKDSIPVAVKRQAEPKKVEEEPLVADTGQTWFKVSVTRNDTPYIKYEGTWPVLLTTEGFATLAFAASKGALVISHGVTFYIYGWPPVVGRIPIMGNAAKSGEVSMIMVPVINGAYGLAISPHKGYIEMTESNNGKEISGHFEAEATNEKKDLFRLKGQFLNIKPH